MKINSLARGLVGHWPLDQESFNPATKRFTDKSPYCNHGTGNGTQLGSADPGFQADRMGQLVRAAPFNGSDDYINCGADNSLNMTDSLTISVMINPTGAGNTWQTVVMRLNNYILQFGQNKRVYGYVFINGSFRSILKEDAIINWNEWYHFVFTWDSSLGSNQLKLYINGLLVTQTTYAGISGNSDTTYIGTNNAGLSEATAGKLHDFRIYNRALSQQEITLLVESYRPMVVV